MTLEITVTKETTAITAMEITVIQDAVEITATRKVSKIEAAMEVIVEIIRIETMDSDSCSDVPRQLALVTCVN